MMHHSYAVFIRLIIDELQSTDLLKKERKKERGEIVKVLSAKDKRSLSANASENV